MGRNVQLFMNDDEFAWGIGHDDASIEAINALASVCGEGAGVYRHLCPRDRGQVACTGRGLMCSNFFECCQCHDLFPQRKIRMCSLLPSIVQIHFRMRSKWVCQVCYAYALSYADDRMALVARAESGLGGFEIILHPHCPSCKCTSPMYQQTRRGHEYQTMTPDASGSTVPPYNASVMQPIVVVTKAPPRQRPQVAQGSSGTGYSASEPATGESILRMRNGV